jgi:hypothetical protein
MHGIELAVSQGLAVIHVFMTSQVVVINKLRKSISIVIERTYDP